ncbi:MAG: (Fe-S)-binding protein [Desulfobulbus sp.]|jgi:Fe-S oxidoreductase|nr:(Fe-S)-binding protein [Desulfobulbus sp.]
MEIVAPANFIFWGIKTQIFSVLIPVIALIAFSYIITRRVAPLLKAAKDDRFNRFGERIAKVFSIWLAQVKQPRYMVAGVLHIIIFFGFLVLALRSMSLVVIGFDEGFTLPFLRGTLGDVYNVCKDYAATLVLIACVIAAIRRGIVKPARYAVPAQYGKDHNGEAVFVLAIIAVLMISESLFEASLIASASGAVHHQATPWTLVALFTTMLRGASSGTLQALHILSYYIHDVVFFFFLCFLPFGKHFHVLTSLFNVFFMRLDKGVVKPVQYGLSAEELDGLETFGVKKIEDFTWKHMLDFYSCADCGRCSDQCPATAVGRPLSPRFLTIKARDLLFKTYPVMGQPQESTNLIGGIYSEDEIWSCTTCGACEEECPLAIEYIDKIVDIRRGMIDEGLVPQSLQKPLSALEKRGNPYGKTAKQRAKWIEEPEFSAAVPVKVLSGGETADTLFFVDSVGSYDDRIIQISKDSARLMHHLGIDFGVLGQQEKDAGNEVKRFGEEMLFQDLKTHNTEAILEANPKNIVTFDPHTYNVLKKDYTGLPPVRHITEVLLDGVKGGQFQFNADDRAERVYTYHDPCYLGRHNLLYEEPRQLLDALPGMNRVEMEKSSDRSFCCSGGGLMLFYEPEEETRMGVVRVNMAKEAGATVLVTACPFCLINMEDAIKIAGLEGQMEVVDLVELFASRVVLA